MSLLGWRKQKRLREGGVGRALAAQAGYLRRKKRRPSRGVGPEMLSPAGLVAEIMSMPRGIVKPPAKPAALKHEPGIPLSASRPGAGVARRCPRRAG